MYREVNKSRHFKKDSGLHAEMVEFQKWECLLMEMCSRAPGTWFGPSSVFFSSLFCFNTLSPRSFQKVLNSNALDEKLACLLPTYIWLGAVSGLRGANPEMHVHPPANHDCRGAGERKERQRGEERGSGGKGGGEMPYRHNAKPRPT